jgi:hypothetical protein
VSTRFEPIEKTKAISYGMAGGIWVMTLFAPPALEDIEGARGSLAAMTKRYPMGFPTLTWVLPEAGFRMDTDARRAASEITRSFKQWIVAQASLLEGTGFQVATVRAIIAGLDLVTGSRSPKKVFAELPEAVDWCLSQRPGMPDRSSANDLTVALSALRATLVGHR